MLPISNMAIMPYSKNMLDRAVFDKRARIMKSLANSSRLMIVERLRRGECAAGALTSMLGLDQTTVSKHLAVLRLVGIVDARRQGNNLYYRLVTTCVADFLKCAGRVLKERDR